MITRVSRRGQVSVPVDVRSALGIGADTTLRWEIQMDGSARVSVVRRLPTASAKALLGYAAKFRKLKRTDEWFQ